jgi:hypothetical protein
MNPLLKDKKEVFDDLYESSFVPKSKIGAVLDLHKSLTAQVFFNIEEDKLWRVSTVHPTFKNNNIRMLSADHAFKDVNFLVDSHEFISSLKPDLALSVELAKQWGASVACYYLLKNCADVLGNEVDEELLDKIKPAYFKQWLADKLLGTRFTQATGTNKTVRYRVKQCLSLFFFAGSTFRSFDLFRLFVISAIKQKLPLRVLFKKNDKAICQY